MLAACLLLCPRSSQAGAPEQGPGEEIRGHVLERGAPSSGVRIVAYREDHDAPAALEARACALHGRHCSKAGELLAVVTPSLAVATSSSGSDGAFRLTVPAGGTYSLWAEGPRGRMAVRTEVRAGDAAVELRLEPAATLAGTIRGARNEEVPALAVRAFHPRSLRAFELVTDARGQFKSSALPPGRYLIVARHPTLLLGEGAERFLARAGDSWIPRFRLEPPVTRGGRVVRQGRPAPGVSVHLVSGGPEQTVTTDAAGRFELHRLPARGGLALEATTARGESSGLREISKQVPLELALHPTGTLAGIVHDPGGRPIGGARLRLRTAIDPEDREARSDPEGRFFFPSILPGRWRLEVEAAGFATATEASPRIVEGATARAELVLQPTELLGGTVVDEDGVPVEAALVRADGVVGWTDADGGFALSGVSPGQHDLEVRGDAPPPFFASVGAPATGVLVRLGSGGVAGRVLGEDGRALEGIELRLDWPGAEGVHSVTRSKTDASGRFELSGLAPARYRLAAVQHGEQGARTRTVTSDVEVGRGPFAQLELRFGAGERLAGRVLDEGGAPVQGAEVSALWAETAECRYCYKESWSEARATSGVDGSFVLEQLLRGPHVLHATTATADSAREKVTTGRSDVVLRLVPHARIRGRVVDASGAPVEELALDHRKLETADGAFDSAPERPGLRQLRFQVAGAPDFFREVEVRAGRTTDLGVVQVPEPRKLGGRVLGPGGAPVLAKLEPEDPMLGFSEELGGATTADGRFALRLAPGPVRLRVTAPGLAPRVVVAGERETKLTIRLGRGATLAGTLRAPGWDPPASLELRIEGPIETRTVKVAVSRSGSFELPGLEPGTHTISREEPAAAGGAAPLLVPIRLSVPESGRVSAVLAEPIGPALDVRVRGQTDTEIHDVVLVPGPFDPSSLTGPPIDFPWNTRPGEGHGDERRWTFRSVEAASWTLLVVRRRPEGFGLYSETRTLLASPGQSWIVELPAELPALPPREQPRPP